MYQVSCKISRDIPFVGASTTICSRTAAGGELDPNQASQAQIAGFNWWGRELTVTEMNGITCLGTKGDVITQAALSVMGEVTLGSGMFCCPGKDFDLACRRSSDAFLYCFEHRE